MGLREITMVILVNMYVWGRHGPLPRPDLTDFWNNRRQESVLFVSKVRLSSPSRPAVHGLLPRPALTNFCNNRRQESVPFVSKVHSGGSSRPSVHGRLPRPALTDFCNNRREESVPFVSKVHPGGPSRLSVHGPTPRPSLVDFCNNRREESVPFVSKEHPGGPSWTYDVLWCDRVWVDEIAYGEYDSRTVILTNIFHRSLVVVSSDTGLVVIPVVCQDCTQTFRPVTWRE